MRKALSAVLLLLAVSAYADGVDFGNDGGTGGLAAGAPVPGGTASRFVTTDASGNIQTDADSAFDGVTSTFTNLTTNGDTVIGSGTEDSATMNADALSIPNDTVITLGGGANGLSITGDIVFSSFSLVDLSTVAFGAVTAASTATVVWTETIDRLNEFVTSSFTVTLAGYYEFNAHSGVSQTAGSACLLLKKNGTTVTDGTVCNQGVTGLASVLDVSMTKVLLLAVNDVVRIDASATTANATFQKMTATIKRLP